MTFRRSWLSATALTFTLASCTGPMAGLNPSGAPAGTSPAATVPAGLGTPAPASVTPAPAPALPAAPPVAKDARARLTGVVLFNDTPVADASLTAIDVATGKAIALTPWSEVPAARKLLSTQKTDAKGAFDFELPKLEDSQVVKLVAAKGGQTFTALFNSRGQAIGGDAPTSATYRLQQGVAISVTVRLRLTAATTAATQAFEGALKLTFQLPAGTSAERQSAVLEAARKAAQEVEAALDKSPLPAIPGLRGISPSLDKSEVAARLVSAVNAEGAVSQLENFRTALTNLGVFQNLFKAVQAELLAVAAQKLDVRSDLAPIDASEFPLDQVVISPSGLLGFSGQRAPINLGGAVTSNFVPTPARGGGGSAATPPPSGCVPLAFADTAATKVYDVGSGQVFGLALLRGCPTPELAFARNNDGLWTLSNLAAQDSTATNTNAGLSPVLGVAQTQNPASRTVYTGNAAGTIFSWEPQGGATGSFVTGLGGAIQALGAGWNDVYAVSYDSSSLRPVTAWSQANPAASRTVTAGGNAWEITKARSMAVYQPNEQTSATLFVGNETGSVTMAVDGDASAPVTLASGLGYVYGLAFATPTLYVSSSSGHKVYAINVNSMASSVLVAQTGESATYTFPSADHLNGPRGLAISEDGQYLYIGNFNTKKILRVFVGDL